MSNSAELDVTLTADLYRHLKTEARRLGVPLTWLVASLVVDTMDEAEEHEFEPEPELEPALA